MPSVPTPSIADTRQDQMFPTLDPSEIKPVRRFGQRRTFAPGEALAKVGDRSCALSIVLSGEIEVTRHTYPAAPPRSSSTAPAPSWANLRSLSAGRRWPTPRRADR